MTPNHSANSVMARARKRMTVPSPDYPPIVDYSSPVETWTFTNHRTGKFNAVVLLPSKRRRDLFAVEVNGEIKSKSMGRDRAMRWVVKGLHRQ